MDHMYKLLWCHTQCLHSTPRCHYLVSQAENQNSLQLKKDLKVYQYHVILAYKEHRWAIQLVHPMNPQADN